MAINPSVSGELQNNYLRPYTKGLTEHQNSLATITLLTTKEQSSEDFSNTVDYLQVLTTPVESINPAPTTSIVDSQSEIPNIRLDDLHDYYGIFNNFSLISVSESKEQLTKIHMNFGGSWNAFFFGEKPTVYTFSGIFLDSEEYPYYQEFSVAYDKYLCGRKCVENQFQMIVSYNGKLISGYMLNIMTSLSATNPYSKAFNFSVLVKEESWYRNNYIYTSQLPQEGFNYLGNYRIMTESFKNLLSPR